MARKQGRATLTAAARPVDLAGRASKRRREKWQQDAWAAYDEVPEVKELILWRSNQLAKLNLFVAVKLSNDDRQEPVPIDSDAVAESGITVSDEVIALCQAELAEFGTDLGGQSEIIRRFDQNLEVAGECYAIGFNALDVSEPSEWVVASIDELYVKDGVRYYVDDPAKIANLNKANVSADDKPRAIVDGVDDMFRVWEPHAQYYGLADCALRACLTEAELLGTMTNQLLAEARSRVGAGFMTIPNELAIQLPGGTPITADVSGEQPEGDEPVMAALMDALIEPAVDPSHPGAVVPTLIRGPKEFLHPDGLRTFGTARPVDATIDQRILARVERLARGMSAPPEKVLGLDKTTFANADQVDEDTWDEYLQPRAEFIVRAITVGYLRSRPNIRALPPELLARICVWYDASDVIAQPDTSGVNADQAFDRNMISDEAYRQARGWSEEDKPSEEQILQRWALRRSVVTVDLAAKLLEAMASDGGIDISEWAVPGGSTATAGVPGDPAGSQAALLAALGVRLDGLRREAIPARAVTAARPKMKGSAAAGRRLTAIDRDLRTRLTVAANAAMDRALEKATNKLRSKVQGNAQLRGCPNRDLARMVGKAAVTAAVGDDVWGEAWGALGASWLLWTEAARTEAVGIIGGLAGFTAAQSEALSARMLVNAEDAWVWLSDSLSKLADARLFDPSVLVPALGEFDASLAVPAGLIRQAVARAGGTAGLDTSQGGVWVTITADGGDAGGYAFGTSTKDALIEGGAGVEGYVWDYGPGTRRTFEPHQQLDGVEFVNFDDDVLSNFYGWPEFAYFIPGDHDGCLCDASPIIIPADEVAPGDLAESDDLAEAS